MKNSGSNLEILNFGRYYFPPKKMLKGLERLIIFAENATKGEIPNGSVFTYASKEYNPAILKSDVGCGITAFILNEMKITDEAKREILKAVDSMGVHLGQGNHFLDVTTAHPVLRRKGVSSGMVFIHSDFNNSNILPLTFTEAKELEQRAKEQRIAYLDKLSRLLGVPGKLYMNWTHNSVDKENDRLVYRKGAINLKETGGVGLLALNPIDGLMLYAAEFQDYQSSMQHGLGRIGSRSELFKCMEKTKYGMAIGYSIKTLTSEIKAAIKRVYNPIDGFLEKFGHQQAQIGVCAPEMVITTKL